MTMDDARLASWMREEMCVVLCSLTIALLTVFEACGCGVSAESTQGIFNMVITIDFLRTETFLAFYFALAALSHGSTAGQLYRYFGGDKCTVDAKRLT